VKQQNWIVRAFRKGWLTIFNNRLINPLLIILNQDGLSNKISAKWYTLKYDESKSIQENVGYSLLPEINDSLDRTKITLRQTAKQFLKGRDKILEIGCGPGFFMETLMEEYDLYGIDLNASFITKAKQLFPFAHFLQGDYLEISFDNKFQMIYMIGVLQYFPPSRLPVLIHKIADQLLPHGIFILHYSHALSAKDIYYNDLRYVRYSPDAVSREAGKYFEVISHHHFIDDRIVKGFDTQHYYFPGSKKRTDTNLNTYLLIAQKK
jgi:SAM-dependent methyltransferase